jgi:hypothetical protein
MTELTTTDVAECLKDLERNLLLDAFSKQKPIEVFVKNWMGQGRLDSGVTVEEMMEAVSHMVGERLAPARNRPVPVVEYQAPVG